MESIKFDPKGKNPINYGACQEIIPDRLYWISDKKPPKSTSRAFYFCIDDDLVY